MTNEPGRSLSERVRRDQIVAATVTVLANDGFRKASIERIAAKASVSKALVLYHFNSKEELIHQTFFRVYEQLCELVGSVIDSEWPADVQLCAWIMATVRVGVQQAEEYRALDQIIINSGIAETRDDATISFTDKEPLYREHEKVFRAGQEAGVFRDFDVRVMAVTVQGAVDATIRYLNARPDADPGHHAQELAELLLAAVRAPSDQ